LLEQAPRYLDDVSFRREILVASLTNPQNQYSRKRISGYALGDHGWDALPQWSPRVRAMDAKTIAALRSGADVPDDELRPLWDGTRPRTMDAWVALGRRAFFEYPLRPEVFAEHVLRDVDRSAEVGLRPAGDGSYPGFVTFADLDGVARVGITCAMCHTHVDEQGAIHVGRARRDFDYGGMRLAYYRDTGAPVDPGLAARMSRWGPGRADITDDEDEDPVAIPDLWGIRSHGHLTQAGTIKHVHPAALAIRQETQILHAQHERVRPPRELAWAMAMFVYSIEPPPTAAPATAAAQRGAAIFEDECEHCHHDAIGSGDPLPADEIGTDPELAFGTARGTGLYRPAALVRVADAAPYLHDGDVPNLEALLSDARTRPGYDGGTRGPGPIPGHLFGTDLSTEQRADVLSYLSTL
jgi:cytochrome c5